MLISSYIFFSRKCKNDWDCAHESDGRGNYCEDSEILGARNWAQRYPASTSYPHFIRDGREFTSRATSVIFTHVSTNTREVTAHLQLWFSVCLLFSYNGNINISDTAKIRTEIIKDNALSRYNKIVMKDTRELMWLNGKITGEMKFVELTIIYMVEAHCWWWKKKKKKTHKLRIMSETKRVFWFTEDLWFRSWIDVQ